MMNHLTILSGPYWNDLAGLDNPQVGTIVVSNSEYRIQSGPIKRWGYRVNQQDNWESIDLEEYHE